MRVEDIDPKEAFFNEKYKAAARNQSAFDYDASYVFCIQSETGILDPDSLDQSED